MVLKINPAHFPLWRNTERLQIGEGDSALVIDRVSASQERLINLLYRGIADDSFKTISASVGQTTEESQSLLKRLAPVLLSGASGTKNELSSDYIDQAFAEIIRASFRSGTDGLAIVNHRASLAVQLMDGDGASLLLALGLASSGLGAIYCADGSPVTRADVGPLGYSIDELGSSRWSALARRLESGPHPCRVVSPSRRFSQQAAVLTGSQLTKSSRYENLLRGSTPHLAIEFSIHKTVVTPIVVPGQTPCLSCRYKFEIESDKDWPSLTTQLQMRNERLDDSASKLFACGAALEVLLRYLDDPRSLNFQGLQLNHVSGEISTVTWPNDENCTCSLSSSSL